MNRGFSFNQLLKGEGDLYAIKEPQSPIALHMGGTNPTNTTNLYFKKFHFPAEKPNSFWKDFSGAATLSLIEKIYINADEIPPAHRLPSPQGLRKNHRQEWNILCQKAAAEIECENVAKLVPSRKETFTLTPKEKTNLLESLFSLLFAPHIENSYRFLVKVGSGIFFGGTPELLFLREKGLIYVPAIAGTRALVSGAPESELHEELLSSAKDRLEHAWVVQGICESLQSLGLRPKAPAGPKVLRTAHLLHLFTPITAEDSSEISSDALLMALHPTPAIGGQPKAAAAKFLFEHETWDRGLFSAPLLFHTPGRDLCLVAIRSALIAENELHFFAGAGYVKGSTAEQEWQETERKLQVMQHLLFGENDERK